jgi:hypothetical protein
VYRNGVGCDGMDSSTGCAVSVVEDVVVDSDAVCSAFVFVVIDSTKSGPMLDIVEDVGVSEDISAICECYFSNRNLFVNLQRYYI